MNEHDAVHALQRIQLKNHIAKCLCQSIISASANILLVLIILVLEIVKQMTSVKSTWHVCRVECS